MPVMRNAGGYVRVYRSLLEWEWYDDDACVRLMLHLILSVNWEPKQWHGQTIQPGQLVTSMDKLAETLGTTRSAIRRTMDKLKSSGEVTIQTNNHWTTVTLGNWAEYQEVQPTNSRPKRQPATDQQPTADRPPATTKELEEGKKGSIEEMKGESARKMLFANSKYSDPALAQAELPELTIDFPGYAAKIRNWSDAQDIRRTDRGWLATYKTFYSKDQERSGRAAPAHNTTPRNQAIDTNWK